MTEFGLPENVRAGNAVAVVTAMGLVTLILRLLPFLAARYMRGALMRRLAVTMPVGVMVVLLVYLGTHGETAWKMGAGIAAAVLLHVWRGNAALSILGSTVLYMLLVNLLP